MHFWYKLLTYLFFPFANIYLILRKINNKEHPIRYKEKLSKINIKTDSGFLVWFHVASVGEALSVLPLVKYLEKEEEIKRILITSITLSSADVLQKKHSKSKKIVHQFLPLDVPNFVNNFLSYWSPNLSIFVDSEIWPNLIYKIKKKKIPLLLINGRITKKTFLRWRFLKTYSKKIFEKFDLCLAGDEESEKYLKILGAQNVKNYGNLKFASSQPEFKNNLNIEFLNKIKKKKIWCAASTHNSEEIFCASSHLELKKTYENILTIIIPRHVERVKKINNSLLNLNLKTCLYSNLHQLDDTTDILLVDTYGEAYKLFNISKAVFLGGSIIKHGGQNPIEAARLGCKIFHGPYIENFTGIYAFLKSLGITKKTETSIELNQALIEEFKSGEINKDKIITKIENYGENILKDVINEVKKYISY